MSSRWRALQAAAGIAALCFALAPRPAAAVEPLADRPCAERLPEVITVAVPGRLLAAETSREALLARLESDVLALLEAPPAGERALPGEAGETASDPCAGERPLQLNVAVGSDYQVLDWLAQGRVDGGIAPTLSLALLQRDGLPLVGAPPSAGERAPAAWRAARPRVAARRLGAGGWRALGDPGREVTRLRDRVWCEALEAAAETPPSGCATTSDERFRLVMPSHLSSGGFLLPLGVMGEDLEWRIGRLRSFRERSGETVSDARASAIREAFWRGVFDRVRLALDHDPLARLAAGEAPALDFAAPREGTVELLYSDGETELDGPIQEMPPAQAGERARPPAGDFLVLRAGSPALVRDLPRGATPLARVQLPWRFPRIAGRARSEAQSGPPTHAFLERAVEIEPYFGVRTFEFTAAEAVRLIALHRSQPDAPLSLVLPGGGVKSAYQSVLIDTLYERALVNRGAGEAAGKLAVDHVVGTSGGSLVGFFVARLGDEGPWELSRLLWQNVDGEPLTSGQIFGRTDMLRWLSLVLAFLCLCLVLVVWKRSALLVASLGPAEQERLEPAWRLLLAAVLAPILLLTPLASRWLSGELAREHVPEIEGLLYALLVWLAMLADQCLVVRGASGPRAEVDPAAQGRGGGGAWISWRPLVLLGAAFVLLPTALRLFSSDEEGLGETPFALAYFLLSVLVVFGGMALPWRLRAAPAGADRARAAGRAAIEYAAAALGVLLLGRWVLSAGGVAIPVFFTGLLLVVLVLGGAIFFGHRGGARARNGLYGLILVLVCALILLLSAPPDGISALGTKGLLATSALGVFPGSLVLITGALVLCVGLLLALESLSPRYAFEAVEDFLTALFVVLLHALAVYAVLMGVVASGLFEVSLLELTGRFWLALVVIALLLALLLLWVVGRDTPRGAPFDLLRRGVGFLRRRHPNGTLVSWRFLRLGLLAVALLGWWNLVVGPALYGNRYARDFLAGARQSFDAAFERHYGHPARFTATFVTPANELETDGTRFFVFGASEDPCPEVRDETGSGARWHVYRSGTGSTLATQGLDAPCLELGAAGEAFLSKVIFASGSPFPVFPAHRVELPRGGEEMFLVDGGYAHNVPVEAARVLAAEGVLILRSSHPLGHLSRPGRLGGALAALGKVPGTLVRNLGRLPAFLFERSQQTDRRSSRDLFVVSISPRREHVGWPSLVDFRTPVVERLQCLARFDLGLDAPDCEPHRPDDGPPGARRIAMVESWGQPEVQLTRTLR